MSFLFRTFATMKRIGYDAKRYFHNNTGLGNYSRTLVKDVQRLAPEIDAVLYDSKSIERTFRLGRKAAGDGCRLFHGLSNELPRDIVRAGIPSIVTMHDVAWRTFPDMYTVFDRHIYDLKYGWSARHATHVVCISQSTKQDIMRFYGVPEERISIIYQPVQRQFYTPMAREEAEERCNRQLPYTQGRDFVLTVGSINSRKNLLGMVKALEGLPPKERPLFVVVGNGREYRTKVERYIDAHGLRKYVRIESNIHDAETLQALYCRARCLMYPSFYEGFGLPVVEAALQRCPVITSNVSSLPEAAGPAAIQVDPCAVSQMANALRRLLSSPEECSERGEQAHDYCMENFSPDRLTRQMLELYDRIAFSD